MITPPPPSLAPGFGRPHFTEQFPLRDKEPCAALARRGSAPDCRVRGVGFIHVLSIQEWTGQVHGLRVSGQGPPGLDRGSHPGPSPAEASTPVSSTHTRRTYLVTRSRCPAPPPLSPCDSHEVTLARTALNSSVAVLCSAARTPPQPGQPAPPPSSSRNSLISHWKLKHWVQFEIYNS